LLRRRIRGKFELLHHFGRQPPVGEAFEKELEGVPHKRTPALGGIGNQDFYRNQAADPLPDLAPRVRATPVLEGRFHGGDARPGIAGAEHARPQRQRTRIDSGQERKSHRCPQITTAADERR